MGRCGIEKDSGWKVNQSDSQAFRRTPWLFDNRMGLHFQTFLSLTDQYLRSHWTHTQNVAKTGVSVERRCK
jgi:hypothetical protein